MTKVILDKITVKFEEDIELTNEEKVNISVGLHRLERDNGELTLKDKPRVRQLINDELDRLNKIGQLSDEAVQNNTYSFWSSITATPFNIKGGI